MVSLGVSRRRREIGIRKAVGATEARIRREVVRRAMTPVFVGGGVGLLLAFAGARMAESLLFGVSPFDPFSLLAGAGVLVVTAAVAAWIPSWAASRTSVRGAVG